MISDIKNPFSTSGPVSNWTYLANVKNISNTYPYGQSYGTNAIYNAVDDYRYGFNGMEKEKNISSSGNTFDFGARVYDSEFPTFLSRDPLEREFPYQSSYVFAGNTPIQAIDENGTRKRVVHLFNVEFDKGEYTVTQLPNYERQDGKSPKNSYGTDEMQYHFNGNFYDDIYKVPGYKFFFEQQTKPVTDKLKLVGQIGTDLLSVWLAMKGTAKNNSSWGKAILATFGLSTTVWQLNLHINGLLNNDNMEGLGNNLGGHLGMKIDFIAKDSYLGEDKIISVEGIFEIVDDIVVWNPINPPNNLPESIQYGISVYNIFPKLNADFVSEKVKSGKKKVSTKSDKKNVGKD